MKRIVLAFASMLLSFVCLAKDPVQVSVMSFNTRGENETDGTNSWSFRYQAVTKMIDEESADVVCLQEATLLQLKYFCESLNRYKWLGVGRQDGKKEGEYAGILYNSKKFSVVKQGSFWLSETPDSPSAGWGADHESNAYWAILKEKKSGSTFLVVNTHIDVEDPAFRQNAVALLGAKATEIGGGIPAVICGGFNMEGGDSCLEALGSGMQNAREVAFTTDNTRTYHNYGKVSQTIDHFFFSGFSSCQEFRTITTRYFDRAYLSDHNPIIANFIL